MKLKSDRNMDREAWPDSVPGISRAASDVRRAMGPCRAGLYGPQGGDALRIETRGQ